MPKEIPILKELPNKFYFKVGEVSELADVPASVLRFWETEFKKIKPKRTPSGQRLYRKEDLALILKIKHLLYKKKFTIQGARQYLKSGSANQ
ncbi:MAG: MerR family transcriptional regulator [Deltaproteobacteria bacterium]|nr:MerR family transcriptional regulator [Deltaproteobacteria bacterium]